MNSVPLSLPCVFGVWSARFRIMCNATVVGACTLMTRILDQKSWSRQARTWRRLPPFQSQYKAVVCALGVGTLQHSPVGTTAIHQDMEARGALRVKTRHLWRSLGDVLRAQVRLALQVRVKLSFPPQVYALKSHTILLPPSALL
ncbi:hypothetical protein BC628DRAFT_270622 [Trametes gibbosa]|nr:hypothetical protein BC628DRAFT_270622 [Trametes gibbosa]